MSHEQANSRPGLSPTPECPEIEALAQMLEKDPPLQLLTHVHSCPVCQAELGMMRSFLDGEPDAEEEESLQAVLDALSKPRNPVPHSSSVRLPRKRRWWEVFALPRPALAAGLVTAILIAVVGIGVWRQNSIPTLSDPGDPILRGGTLELVSPRGSVPDPVEAFTWQLVEGASSYRLALFSVDGRRLAVTQTSTNRAPVPNRFRAELLPGRTILWQVEAWDREGELLARSERLQIRIEYQP